MKSLSSLAISLAIAASLVPAFAFADTYAQNCGTSWNSWGTTNCTTGNLLVYVQVVNNTGVASRAPSDFAVTVSAPTASPSSFPGSLQGTSVLVGGTYAVNALQQSGYSASYSSGCNGTLTQNASATCIITESNTGAYSNYPYSYYPNQYYNTNPYNYNGTYVAPLTCSPSGQTYTIGQNATFTAQGGEFSQFNWKNSAQLNNISYNIGRSYSTTLLSPGTETVTVTNGAQSAICTVTVVGFPIAGYPYQYQDSYQNGYSNVTVTPTYIPSLPNTGFAPMDTNTLAIALAFIFAAALAAYPYARKAFAIVIR